MLKTADASVQAAARALRAARSLVVTTGAGMSSDSGVPTFRDALTGLWARYDPEELATEAAFRRNPARVFGWYVWRRRLVRAAVPHAGYHALVALERIVPELVVVTQNVDGLHRRAGSSRVIELHGSLERARCSRENTVFESWDETGEAPPRCRACGAPLRPDVVWFGELLPPEALRAAERAARNCDLFLSIGTSNLVEPAASLPWRAAAGGAEVVVINVTMEGQRSGPGIHHLIGPAGEVLPALLQAAWPAR